MALADPVVMPLAEALLDCLAQEIAKVVKPPAYVQLRTGTVVDWLIATGADECCDGLAWVRPVTFFPSSSVFPNQDDVPLPKGVSSWAITFELGAIRCAPTGDQSTIPTGGQWHDTVAAVLDDAAAMRRAICCFEEIGNGRKRTLLAGAWEPLDVQGGCTGGVMQVTVRGPACDCAEAGPGSS